MRVLISGICGYMGRQLLSLCEKADDIQVVCGVDIAEPEGINVPVYKAFGDVSEKVDLLIDFSHHSQTFAITEYALENNVKAVIATTAQTSEEKEAIYRAAEKIPVFFSANFSVGVALLCSLAVEAAKAMDGAEIEIIEKHHNRKLDAPSGTALAIAEAIKNEARPNAKIVCGRQGHAKRETNEIGISSVRMGNIVGDHEVIIGTDNQTITLRHEAHNRALFAEGAIAAARYLINMQSGLYDVNTMIGK